MVWGLGLPKTGTSSLAQALWALHPQDLRIVHSDPKVNKKLEERALTGGVGLAIPSGYMGAVEMPAVRRHYMTIHQEDPGAVFILTVRELSGWLDSMEAHRQRNSARRLWDIFDNSRQDLAEIYTAYHLEVFDYFRGTGDLLILNIVDGQGEQSWDKLETFLGWKRLAREAKFPHLNQTPKESFKK